MHTRYRASRSRRTVRAQLSCSIMSHQLFTLAIKKRSIRCLL